MTEPKNLHIRQTLHNLKFQFEEEVRIAATEYQSARIQFIGLKQKLDDITYLLEKYDDDDNG